MAYSWTSWRRPWRCETLIDWAWNICCDRIHIGFFSTFVWRLLIREGSIWLARIHLNCVRVVDQILGHKLYHHQIPRNFWFSLFCKFLTPKLLKHKFFVWWGFPWSFYWYKSLVLSWYMALIDIEVLIFVFLGEGFAKWGSTGLAWLKLERERVVCLSINLQLTT